IAHPIRTSSTQRDENVWKYWLDVDWQRFGTPVPFLPHPFDLEPTGNIHYPYWYHATRQNGKRVWVLLSADQIIPLIPGKSITPNVGTSPTWMCLGFLAEEILVKEERIEKMLYSLTNGLNVIGGVTEVTPETIKKEMREGREEALEQGFN